MSLRAARRVERRWRRRRLLCSSGAGDDALEVGLEARLRRPGFRTRRRSSAVRRAAQRDRLADLGVGRAVRSWRTRCAPVDAERYGTCAATARPMSSSSGLRARVGIQPAAPHFFGQGSATAASEITSKKPGTKPRVALTSSRARSRRRSCARAGGFSASPQHRESGGEAQVAQQLAEKVCEQRHGFLQGGRMRPLFLAAVHAGRRNADVPVPSSGARKAQRCCAARGKKCSEYRS